MTWNPTNLELSQLVKFWQSGHGLEPDGLVGPATRASLETAILKFSNSSPTSFKPFDGPLPSRPNTWQEMLSLFGNPGVGQADPHWEEKSLVYCQGNTALPGVNPRLWVRIHKMVEPYAREGLRRAVAVCPQWKPERVAGYVFRHQRHDPDRPLSSHSLGSALDFDPHLNFAKTFPKGKAPKAFSDEWKAVWGQGIPKGVVDALKSCGFVWGADWDEDGDTSDHTYVDPMHFEFRERGGNISV